MLSAVVLAAGQGKRMGTLKQLLPWRGNTTILETVVKTVLACPDIDDEVRVVLGAGKERIFPLLKHLADPRLVVLENPDYRRGMLSSIQIGVANLSSASRGFVLFLGDQPLLTSALVASLVGQWRQGAADFLVPIYQGRRGHPVFFHEKYVPEILALEEADQGLRTLLRRYESEITYYPVDSPAIFIDLDNPEDYQKYRPLEGS